MLVYLISGIKLGAVVVSILQRVDGIVSSIIGGKISKEKGIFQGVIASVIILLGAAVMIFS